MLTFFRRIRKGLLDGGSTSKYLLYAIGEIALVVIGILIALQINNLNERKKALENEKELLIEVYEALKTDSISIEGSQNLLNRSTKFYESIYKIYTGSLPTDSLNTRIIRRATITRPVVDINYPNLASEVIDQNVKLEVLEYYQSLARWREYLEEYNEFIRRKMRPFLGEMQFQNYGSQYSDEINNINNEKLLEELGNPKVQQMFFEAAQRTGGDWPYRTAMERQKSLKIAIEKVIR